MGNSNRTPYALGARPTAVDAALIGGLRGHTDHDPIPDLEAYDRIHDWNLRNHPPHFEQALPDLIDHPPPLVEHLLALVSEQYAPFIRANRAALESGNKAFVAETYGDEVSYLCRDYPEYSRRLIVERIKQQLDAEERSRVLEWLRTHGIYECFAPDA